MSQHWLPAKEPGQSLMVGYDRPLDNYFAHVHDAAGKTLFALLGTTDLAELRARIEPYLDTRKVGLHDVSSALFMERLRETLRPGSHPMHKVEDWRDLAVRDGEAQAQHIVEPSLTPDERRSVRDFVRLRNDSPQWQLAGRLAAASDRDLEESLSPWREGPEPVWTTALAANAAKIARHTTGLRPQQRDRQVVGIRAGATGGNSDRHGRCFHVDAAEEWTVEKRPGFLFTGANGETARADLTIIARAGTVPVVVATAGHPEQLAAALLTRVFPERAQAAEPFLLVEHRPDQQRFEHLDFADYRIRDEGRAPRIGDVVARHEIVAPAEDLAEEQEQSLEPEPTQTRAPGLRR